MLKAAKVLVSIGLLGSMTIVAGCTSQSKSAGTENHSSSGKVSAKPYYQKMIEKGLDAVADGDNEKAQSYFENAVDANKKSVKAKTYLAQVKTLNRANADFNSGDYTSAKEDLSNAPEGKNTSTALTTKINQLYDKISSKLSSASSSQSSNGTQSTSSSEDGTKVSAADHTRANDIRNLLASNQDFSSSVLKTIPDSEILAAASPSLATNSDIARASGTLLKKYPNLK